MRKMIEACPSCASSNLTITEVTCDACGTQVRSRYQPSPLSVLDEEQQTFLLLFVRSRGNLKELEKTLGVSYPTVRAKLDEASAALEAVQRNAHASGVGERVSVLDVDAFDACRQLRDAGERFDVVVVDPPAFIKRKKDAEAGTLAYRRINEAALKLVADGGLIVSCSCSHHFSADALLDALNRAACALGLRLRVLKRLAQSADHPIHPGMPETEYLKGFLAEVRRP